MINYLDSIKKNFNGVRATWRRYWSSYGGWKSIFSSTYFIAAVIITIINFGAWSKPGWWDIVISTSPTILGFTLAGLAVFLGMDSGFSKIIAGEEDGKRSPYGGLVSAFVHFIIVQAIAFILALTHKSLFFTLDFAPNWWDSLVQFGNPIFWFIGYLIYMYSVTQIIAAAFAVLRASNWYESYISATKKAEMQQKAKPNRMTIKRRRPTRKLW